MNTKLLLAALIGAIVAFFLGWLVWGILLMDYYNAYTTQYEGLMRNPPVLWALFLSQLAWTFMFAYIFDKWANITTFKSGFMAFRLLWNNTFTTTFAMEYSTGTGR